MHLTINFIRLTNQISMVQHYLRVFIAGFSLLLLALSWQQAVAQVTTSSLTGIVTDEAGEPLPGATVVALHTPSGTSYGTATRPDGAYRISNMRVGGPYTVTVSYIGFLSHRVEDVYLTLGETYNLGAVLQSGSVELDELVVTALEDRTRSEERRVGKECRYRSGAEH